MPPKRKRPKVANVEFMNRYNFWAWYRKEPLVPNCFDIMKYYRKKDFRPLAGPNPPAPVLPARGIPLPILRQPTTPNTPADMIFLGARPPEFISPNWIGVKILGRGAQGTVALWRFIAPGTIPPPPVTEVAIKSITNLGDIYKLQEEGRFLQSLVNTSHIVQLKQRPVPVLANENLGAEWTGQIRRLVLEYCREGCLADSAARRKERQFPLAELTLALIFECLIDGLVLLAYGADFIIDGAGLAQSPAIVANFTPIVHFDLKPDNIFLQPRQLAGPHFSQQVCKIGDFGHALDFPANNLTIQIPGTDQETNHNNRHRGTPGYISPEQFTSRWDFRHYITSGVAGAYGSHTNVWGVGVIMYELMVLQDDVTGFSCVPEPDQPFAPPLINNAPGKGIAYGTLLQSVAYSATLKNLVQECLYEQPTHRPTLLNLKRRTMALITALRANPNSATNQYSDLANPGPPTMAQLLAQMITAPQRAATKAAVAALSPALVPAPYPVFEFSYRCTYCIPETRRLCTNRRQVPPAQRPGLRCHAHMNRMLFP